MGRTGLILKRLVELILELIEELIEELLDKSVESGQRGRLAGGFGLACQAQGVAGG
jgi:hypothetical protein